MKGGSPVVPEDVAKLIGKMDAPTIYEIEKGQIRKHADAIGDRNPLYWNEDHARNSRYGSLISPPGFFGWPVNWSGVFPFSLEESVLSLALEGMNKAGFPFILDGGVEFEFLLPVKVGDVIVSSCKLAEVTEREGKSAKMFFIALDVTYTNQDGAVVCKRRQTTICR
jgi:acyl dehydratase